MIGISGSSIFSKISHRPSFLSSANIFAFAFAIYLYNKKWGIWFLFATLLMTTARVIAGVHYPSDILGGMIVGVMVAYLAFRYLEPVFKKIINRFI